MDTVGTACSVPPSWQTAPPKSFQPDSYTPQSYGLPPTPNRAAPIDHQKRDRLTANITSNSETEASTIEQLRKENALQKAQLNEFRSLRQQVIEMKGQHNNQQQRARLDSNLPISL